MRADQIERLKAVSEKLAEVVLGEADPDTWPGAGRPLGEITKQERGDRFWCKRNAAATFSLLARAEALIADASEIGAHGQPHERPDLDAEIDQAEKAAAMALKKARERSSSLVKHSRAGG